MKLTFITLVSLSAALINVTIKKVSAEAAEKSGETEPNTAMSPSTDNDDAVPVDPNPNAGLRHRFQFAQVAVDLTNPQNFAQIQQLANTVVQQMNRNWNGFNSYGLANVISATVQSGCTSCYTITMTIGQTVCQNNPYNPPNPAMCPINNTGSGSFCQCVANVFVQQNVCFNCGTNMQINYSCQKVFVG